MQDRLYYYFKKAYSDWIYLKSFRPIEIYWIEDSCLLIFAQLLKKNYYKLFDNFIIIYFMFVKRPLINAQFRRVFLLEKFISSIINLLLFKHWINKKQIIIFSSTASTFNITLILLSWKIFYRFQSQNLKSL